MSLELFIARRHLMARKPARDGSGGRIGFISFIAYLSVAGIAIGVASLIITLSIVNGFEREIREKIIGFDSHIRVRMFHRRPMSAYESVMESVREIDGVRAVYPYVSRETMIRSRTGFDGMILEGVLPDDETYLRQAGARLSGGSGVLTGWRNDGMAPVVLGLKLASRLDVSAGDTVTLLMIEGTPGPFNVPFAQRFQVSGVFNTGMVEYDDAYAYTTLEAAQGFFGYEKEVTGIKVFIHDGSRAGVISNAVEEALGGYPYYPMTWRERHRNLFKWLDTQKVPLLIVFGLISVVAIFNITSSLIMIVIEKTMDIGVLKAMGMGTKRILRVFLTEGLIIGAAGTMLGAGIAYLLGWIQQTYSIIALPPDVYFMDALPVQMRGSYFIGTVLAALALSMAATIYPALKAARLQPADSLREE